MIVVICSDINKLLSVETQSTQVSIQHINCCSKL